MSQDRPGLRQMSNSLDICHVSDEELASRIDRLEGKTMCLVPLTRREKATLASLHFEQGFRKGEKDFKKGMK